MCSLDVLSGSTPKTKSFSRHAVLDHEISKNFFPLKKCHRVDFCHSLGFIALFPVKIDL